MIKMILEFAKRFARNGFYVFPTYKSTAGAMLKPYGWSGSPVKEEEKAHLAIPATNFDIEIDSWPEQLKTKYNTELAGYGILGKNCVIIDIDTKGGKSGSESYTQLARVFNIPKAALTVKTKSGGIHLFFARPHSLKTAHIKSVASCKIDGREFEGVDLRGNGGFVQGATSDGEWVKGEYTITRGGPEETLSELPESFLKHFAASQYNDLDAMIGSAVVVRSNDIASILRRGELPETVPNGQRNEAFFVFLTALKQKGIERAIAKNLAEQLALRCEDADTLAESVNIEDMLDRIFEKTTENPYDIGLDLVKRGLVMLTSHRSRPTYILLDNNPYLMTFQPADLSSMREMLLKYSKQVQMADGKMKILNPIDIAIRRIPDNQKADTLGFLPGADNIFTFSDDATGTRYLNTYQAPTIITDPKDLDHTVFEEFKLLIARIFGPEESMEYQLGLDFCAWLLQNPKIKIVIAPFLMSKTRGVGKSLFLSLLTRLYGHNKQGERQARTNKLKDLMGRFFNPTGCVLNIFDEVQFGIHKGMRQETTEFWRELKRLVTDDTWPVEIKNGGSYNIPNPAATILAGNTGGNFPIEEFDRRIWVINNSPAPLERGTVDRLFDIVKNTGTANGSIERNTSLDAIRYGLLHHKIALPLDDIRAPMNDAKREMLTDTLNDYEAWFFEYFENPDNLFAATPIISDEMFEYILQNSQEVWQEKWREDSRIIFRNLRRHGMIDAIRIPSGAAKMFYSLPSIERDGSIIVKDRSKYLYTVKNHTQYDHVDGDQVKKLYLQNLQTIQKWRKQQASKRNIIDVDSFINSI